MSDNLNMIIDGSTETLASKFRNRLVAELKKCDCYYPMIKMKNGNGHSCLCPAYATDQLAVLGDR